MKVPRRPRYLANPGQVPVHPPTHPPTTTAAAAAAAAATAATRKRHEQLQQQDHCYPYSYVQVMSRAVCSMLPCQAGQPGSLSPKLQDSLARIRRLVNEIDAARLQSSSKQGPNFFFLY